MRNAELAAKLDRREFFRNSGRTIILGGLAVVAAVSARSHWQTGAVPCERPVVCAGCDLFHDCDQPKAVAARQTAQGGRL